jgi:hypothetical protein
MSWLKKGKRRKEKSLAVRKPRRGQIECLEPRMCLTGFTYQLPGYSTLASGLPVLNSRPGAPAAIYLCFVGDSGNSLAAYSTDSDATTFNTSEQSDIYTLWQSVSIYYSMFDVNVTTVQPGTNGTPLVPTGWDTLTSSVSGGATTTLEGVPDSSTNSVNPQWDVKYRFTGPTHEEGHDFGLNHQGTYDLFGALTSTYSGGSDALHGAMMGDDTAQKIHKWLIGHPNGNQGNLPMPTVLQDDMAVIANTIKSHASGYAGDGYGSDDYGNTIAAATPLTLNNGNAQTTGVIERLGDVDTFSLVSTGGRYSLSATRAMPDVEDSFNSGSQVDLKLTVYDSMGNIVAAQDGDPIAAISTQTMVNNQFLNVTLGSGTYYVAISSHGNYDDQGAYNLAIHALPSGWSAQNLGIYAMPGTVTYDPITNPSNPTYTVSNVSFYSDQNHASQQYELAYEMLQGNGTIIAKVNSWQQWKDWGNSPGNTGLMIRNTLDAGSAYAFAAYTTSATPWLKLVRSGNTFTAYSSINGTSWSSTGSWTLSMNSTVYIGLATWAGTGVFSDVSVTVQNGGVINPSPTLNALSAPGGLSVAAATSSTIALSWGGVSGATGYVIERSSDGDPMGYISIATTNSGTTSYTDTGLSGFQRYFYRLRAQNASGVSTPSSVVSQITRASAATNLTVSSYTNSTLIANWSDAGGETGYRLERSTDGSTWTTVTTLTANIPSYTDTGLTSSTQYYYRVVSLDAGGDAAVSTMANSYTRPDAVTTLSVTSKTENQVVVSWSSVARISGYHVYRVSQDHGTATLVGTMAAGTTTFTDTSTSIGRYLYYVAAYNPIADSTVSNTVVVVATPSSSGLASPWVTQDLGNVGYGGATKYAGGTLTMVASGQYLMDSGSTSDAFRFTYAPVSGDCTIIARVTSVDTLNKSAPAGVMIRSSISDLKSPAAYLSYANASSGSGAITFSTRLSNTTGATTAGSQASLTQPYWLKLIRSGSSFSAYASPDGATWTQVGSAVTISMGTGVYVGLTGNCPWQYWWDDHASPMSFDNITVNGAPPASSAVPTVATPAAASPSPVTNKTASLSVVGADSGGEASLTYTWSAIGTPPASVSFSANGSNVAKNCVATFSKAGTYQLRATITNASSLSATSDVTVTVSQTFTSVSVSPATATVVIGGSNQFAATALDQFGVALTSQPAWIWTSTSGSISSSGLFTAASVPGTATITAKSGSISGTASVTVTNSAPTITSAASATPNLVSGTTTNLSVTATDDAGEASLRYTWAMSSGPGGVTFSINNNNAAKSAMATFSQAGNYTLTVTVTDLGGMMATSSTSVTVAQTLSQIAITPASSGLYSHGICQFSAAGLDQFGMAMSPEPTFIWTILNGGGSIDNNGLFTALYATGSATVQAASGAVTGNAAVNVTNAAPTVTIPAAAVPSLVTATTTSLSVTAADDAGDANLTYHWTVIGPAGVSFSDNDSNSAESATVTFNQAGNYTATVTIADAGGLTATSSLSITVAQTLAQIGVSPATSTVVSLSTQQFAATAYDQFGAEMSVQPAIEWSAVSGTITAGGLYSAPGVAGSDTITAFADGASGTAIVRVASSALNIVAWQSAEVDGDGKGEVAMTIPADRSFIEPRGGGIRRLLVAFDSAVDPATFVPASVVIAGNGLNGSTLDLSSLGIATSLRDGNMVGVIDFNQPLPDVARYAVGLVRVTDVLGAPLAGASQCLMAALAGDVNGDGKVDTSDLSQLKQQFTNHVNPANLYQVRADYTTDGRVDGSDLTAMWNQRNHSVLQIPDPVITALAAARVAAMQSAAAVVRSAVAPSDRDELQHLSPVPRLQ